LRKRKIRVPVVVVVAEHRTQLPAGLGEEPGRPGDIDEGAVPLVAIQHPRLAGIDRGIAVHPDRVGVALLVIRQIELQVVGHVQVEIAVVVVVDETGVGAPAGIADAGRTGAVGEGAVSLVAVEHVGTVVGHVQVEIAVVVAVADAGAHPVSGIAHAGRIGDVGEGAVSLVAVERVGRRLAPGRRVQVGAVEDVQVQMPVPVVVEERRARAHRLGHVPATGGAVDVPEVDTRFHGHLHEPRRACSARRAGRQCHNEEDDDPPFGC